MRGLVGAAPERLVDDHEAERARADLGPPEPELIGEARSQDGVGELLLLSTRLASGVRVVLELGVVLAPALACGEHEPVAHVGDLGGPAAIQLRTPLASSETLDDRPYLQKLGFRVLGVVRAGEGTLRTGPELGLEFADVGVRRRTRLEPDVVARVVVDLAHRLVDAGDAFPNGLALAGELGLEVGDFADGVLVQQLLEPGLEARQVVGLQPVEHGAILEPGLDAGIHFGGVQRERLLERHHRLDDAVPEPPLAMVLGVYAGLEPLPHVLLAVVAGLHRQLMLGQGLGPHPGEFLEPGAERLRSRVDALEHGLRLLAQIRGILLALLGLGARFSTCVQLLLRGRQTPVDLRELCVQLCEHVRRRGEPSLFIAKPCNLGRKRPPVDLAELGVLLQPGEALEPLPNPSLLALHSGHPASQVAELRLDAPRSRFQGVDLGRVGPAEHVTAAIVDAVPVVLFVSLAGGLDLAGPGNGVGFTPKLLLILAARHVEALRELALQPLVEPRVRLDRQLSHQGVRVQAGQRGPAAPAFLANPEVDEASREVRLVNPARHARVVCVGNEERQSETAQQALRRSFPVAFVVAHLYELADEGHLHLRREVQRFAQRRAHGDLPGRDVVAAGLEALDLGGEYLMLLSFSAKAHPVLGQVVLHRRIA